MHARFVRSVAVAFAAAGALTWMPVASAAPAEPNQPASAAPAEAPAADAGRVEITTKDTVGDLLPGATFLLLDSTGQEAGRGQTDAQGKLAFPDLAPGVYRLKQTASGSPLHEVATDQDIIVTPGATTRLTIADPLKTAQVLLRVRDDKGGLLPGATVTIGTGNSALLTLSTGAEGTASGELAVPSRSAKVWVKEVEAPAGYNLNQQVKTITVAPGTSVTVTFTNTTKTVTHPEPDPSDKPTDKPTSSPSRSGKPSGGTGDDATPSASISDAPERAPSSAAAVPVGSSAPTTHTGSLAHTGADATPWLIGGAAVLIAAGGGTLLLARRDRRGPTEN